MKYLSSVLLLLAIVACQSPSDQSGQSQQAPATVEDAAAFITRVNQEAKVVSREQAQAEWVKSTYITDDTQAIAARVSEKVLAFNSRVVEQTKAFDGLPITGPTERAMKLLKLGSSMPAPDDPAKRKQLAEIATSLESAYGRGKYCDGNNRCSSLGALSRTLAISRDYDELLEAWTGWRTVAPPMRQDYTKMVALMNEGAKELGFKDAGELWRGGYDMTPAEFESEAERLWGQVQPLYEELHCYVRDQLAEQYGEDKVPPGEPIPAHLLGNMWAQGWTNIYDLVEPFPGVNNLDVSASLKEKNYTPVKMTRTAEAFFTSLGLQELPNQFWQYSMLSKPADRDVVCHASAWPMDGQDDVRIKMCIQPSEEDFTTIHHELGHIYYFLAQKDLDFVFLGGAHDGFHEAIGDTITLSMTPEYMQEIGLIGDFTRDGRGTINQQMKMALDKIAFLPFGKMVDQWRWKVFSGEISSEDLNGGWWELREKYQGVSAPVARGEDYFDPGAKYHVPANVPYTRYFLSYILQFQFYKAMCDLAGHEGPLNECSFYGSKQAGSALNEMLTMGRSQPWPDALEKLTGTREMDASAIIDYFQPLMGWLKEQNQGQQCGWDNT